MNLAVQRYLDEEQWYPFLTAGNVLAPTVARSVAVARPQLSSPSVVHNSKWAKPTIDRLMALAPLRDNWDQRGSAAVRADVLSFAWTILAQIMPSDGKVPAIIPLGNGGVQLEWSNDNIELEMEVTRPFEVSAFLFDGRNGGEAEMQVQTDSLDQLTQLIRQHFRSS